MDQTTARRLAAQVGGVATQESRLHGHWPKPGEPWVVAAGSLVLREVPGVGPHDYEPGDDRHPMHTDPDCRVCGGRKH